MRKRVVVLYVLVALVITWPLALHMRDVVLGDLESDVWKHVWGFWWMKQCLVESHILPLYTRLLNYPYGGSLFFIDPLGGLMALPLQFVLSPATAYNVLILFNMVLAAVGAHRLARYCWKDERGAFVAGVIYGFSPYVLANVTSGISESFNIGWIPLFFLLFLRTLREPAMANAVWAGIYLALATVGCWYYGVFCTVFACLLLALHLAAHLAVRRRRRPAASPGMGNAVGRLGIVLLAGGFLYATQRMLDEPWQALAFWYWMGGSAAGLLGLLLWIAASRRSADAPLGDFLRRALLILLPFDAAAFSVWMLLLLLPRTWPPTELAGDPMRIFLLESSILTFWLALRIMTARLPALLATAAVRLQRWLAMLALLTMGGVVGVATFLGVTRWYGTAAIPREAAWQEQAWTAVGWLVLLWLLARAHGQETVPWRLPWRQVNRQLRYVTNSALLSLVLLYLFAPPMAADRNLAVWGGGAVCLVVLANLRGLAGQLAAQTRALGPTLREIPQVEPVASDLTLFYRTLFKRLMTTALVTLILVMPFAYAFRRTLNSEISLVYRVRNNDNVDFHLSDQFHNISYLMDYVTPGKAAVRQTYTVDRLSRVSYPGVIVLLLAALGAVSQRRRLARWWLAVGAVAATFSLGPFLYVTPEVHLEGHFPLYMWMYEYFPFFSQISIPYRFDVVVMLALAVLAAGALSRWMRGRDAATCGLVTASISLAILFEVMLVSPAPFPLPESSARPPDYAAWLGAQPGAFGILDLPLQRYEGELLPGEYFYYQTVHGKSIPNRVEGEIPLYVNRNRFMVHLFDLEHDYMGYQSETEATLRDGLKELRDFRFKYFVVHENLLRPGARGRIDALLTHFLGPPQRREDNVSIYQVYPDATLSLREKEVR